MRIDRLAGALLIALAGLAAWQSRRYPLGTLAEPGPGWVPLTLALALGVLGLVVALVGGRSQRLAELAWGELRHAVAILGAAAFAALALERLGYRITVFVLMLVLLWPVERRSLPAALAVSLGFAFGTYWLFADMLRSPLPLGPWNL